MSTGGALTRRLGLGDAVVIGLGAMLGAGVFTAFAPAAAAAGAGLLWGLLVAGVVAYCNATSSARLAVRYPSSGGAYVYGRERLGDFWGYLAGWAFVVGKTASCAAMALTVGAYVAPAHSRVVAVVAVVALTALTSYGVQKGALATRVVVAVVLGVLVLVVLGCLTADHPAVANLTGGPRAGVFAVLQAAGFLFFAFAGYARIATLGEEVRDPARTISRAIPLALLATLAVYAAVAATVLAVLGPARLAAASAPLAAAVGATSWSWLGPLVRVGAAVAATGSLLSLLLGVSRTGFAMARGRHLPGFFDAVHPRHGVPHRAELAVAAVVIVVVLLADVRGAIGFSSFAVLGYYAVANASAYTLGGGLRRIVPVAGLVGCLLVAASLPARSTVGGLIVLAVGVAGYVVRRRVVRRRVVRPPAAGAGP